MISRLRALWNNVFRRNQLEHDLDEELHAYLALVAAEKARSGISPEQAWRDARREMGGVDQVRQNVRDIRAGVLLDRLAQDLRYGIRTLAKSPAFSLVAVATLALGIGANTAMFSLLDQIVLSLLPVRHPEQLVIVRETGNHYGNSYGINTVSWPMFEDLRDHNQVFSGMFCRFPTSVTVGYGDRAAQIQAELVSASYFPILGVGAALGRTIAPDDDAVPDSRPVVVLSYSFWRNYFNGDRSIVGRSIALNSYKMTVIGVSQPGFDGVETGNPAKVFVPIMMKTEMTPQGDGLKDRRRRLSWVTVYGRLKPGISAEQAQASLQPLLHSILAMEVQQPFFRAYPAADRLQFLRNRIELLPASDSSLRDHMRKPLWLLVALTAAVLLLACANLANLMLARATAREREIAVRLAIGAARSRIVRQLMVETLLLSGAGALVGLGLAFLADSLLLRMYLPAASRRFCHLRCTRSASACFFSRNAPSYLARVWTHARPAWFAHRDCTLAPGKRGNRIARQCPAASSLRCHPGGAVPAPAGRAQAFSFVPCAICRTRGQDFQPNTSSPSPLTLRSAAIPPSKPNPSSNG